MAAAERATGIHYQTIGTTAQRVREKRLAVLYGNGRRHRERGSD